MRPFEIYYPESTQAASQRSSADAPFKAAGIDLLDRMKERVESPKTVIDLQRLRKELALQETKDGTITLGALTTLAQIETSTLLQGRAYDAIRQAAGSAATPQVRNRATLAGNLLQMARCWYLRNLQFSCAHSKRGTECLALTGENRYHAILGWQDCVRVHPSNLAPALIAMDAQVLIQGGKDKLAVRNCRVDELYPAQPTAAGAEHTLATDEIVVFAQLAAPKPGTRSAYCESREKLSFDWPTTAAAVCLQFDGRRIVSANIVLGAVAARPWVARAAADALVGKEATEQTWQACAKMAFAEARPLPQNAYKIQVGQATLIDALMAAAKE